MRKIAILFLCLMLFGCSQKEEIKIVETDYIKPSNENIEQKLAIYSLDTTGEKISSNIVPVIITSGKTKAQAALDYLFNTKDYEFTLNEKGIPDYTVKVTNNIAIVRIKNPYKSSEKPTYDIKRFALHYGVVNTLTSMEGIDYVSVYAGTSELGSDYYIGPSSFLQRKVTDEYNDFIRRATANSQEVYIKHPVLTYYVSKDYNYIVPERHTVAINPNDPTYSVNNIISELSKSPIDTLNLKSPIISDVYANSAVLEGDTITVDLSAPLSVQDKDNDLLSYASLYYSLTNANPKIQTMKITINGSPFAIDQMSEFKKSDLSELIGTYFKMYVSDLGGNSLYGTNKYVKTKNENMLKAMINSLLYENISGDKYKSAIPKSIKSTDIVDTYITGNTAVVNFSSKFYDTGKNLSKKEESLMVYSIVNTLCGHEKIENVQFLVNGKSFNTLTGNIDYSKPLIPNPGLNSK